MSDAPPPASSEAPDPEWRLPAESAPPGAPTVWYASAQQDVRNGVAQASAAVGVVALIVFPLGPILGIIALALGVVGLARARNLPGERGRSAAFVGIVLGMAGMLVGGVADLWILKPIGGGRPQSARRLHCAANLSGIGKGMKIYANDNNGWLPMSRFEEPGEGAGNATAVSFIGQMGAAHTSPTPAGATVVHPSRSLFMLVIDGTCTAKSFVCPESGDTEDDLRNAVGGALLAAQPRSTRFDFKGYPYLSYGYQIPFGRMGRPSESLDAKMAIAADKGPFYKAGQPRSDGTVPDLPTMTPGAALTFGGATSAVQLLQLSNDKWKPYNSRNHEQEGENVLFMDGHVEYVRKPIVGVNHDNIYTVQGPNYGELDVMLGRLPADRLGPFTDTDAVIVP